MGTAWLAFSTTRAHGSHVIDGLILSNRDAPVIAMER